MQVFFTKNPVPVEAITTTQAAANFHFEIDIEVSSGFLFTRLATLKSFPDIAGYLSINIARLLAANLEPDVPGYNQSVISRCTKSIKYFRAKILERYGNPVATYSTTYTDGAIILQAGMSFIDYPGNEVFAASNNKFLTWQPNNKLISAGQHEYLYYSTINKNFTNIRLHVQAHFSDGSNSSALAKSYVIENIVANGYTNIILPVGPDQLDLSGLFPGKTVLKYTVWVNESDDPASTDNRSEERTYLIDDTYHRHQRWFIYQNSLGAFETLRTTGNAQPEVDYERYNGKAIVDNDYTPDFAQYYQYDNRSRHLIKCNTGYLYRGWKEHLQEFYHSRYIFEVKNGMYLPVVLQSDSLDLPDYRVNVHEAEFEYRYANENEAYSKRY